MMRVPTAAFVLLATAVLAPGVQGYDGCRVADLNADGAVDDLDYTELLSTYGQADARKDLDGNGTVGEEDAALLLSFRFANCAKICRGDLNGDRVVGAADRALVEASLGLDCRQDLDRDDHVDGDGDGGDDDTDMLFVYMGSTVFPHSAEARADFNSDQQVNTYDLRILARSIPRNCQADLNKDGKVDVSDIWALLASWGKCS